MLRAGRCAMRHPSPRALPLASGWQKESCTPESRRSKPRIKQMRKRIVINLDAPQGGPAPRGRAATGKRSRWRRILGIFFGLVFIVVVVAVVGGFFGWRRYQSTP